MRLHLKARSRWILFAAVFICSIVAAGAQEQGGELSKSEIENFVKAHNAWRSKFDREPLRWSSELAEDAELWARKLKSSGCEMVHSSGHWGENLYWASAQVWTSGRREAQSVTPRQVVDAWGSEARWFDLESNTCKAPPGRSCGHFTQLIWGDTERFGCGRAICEDLDQVWVCRYLPAGNIRGQAP